MTPATRLEILDYAQTLVRDTPYWARGPVLRLAQAFVDEAAVRETNDGDREILDYLETQGCVEFWRITIDDKTGETVWLGNADQEIEGATVREMFTKAVAKAKGEAAQ